MILLDKIKQPILLAVFLFAGYITVRGQTVTGRILDANNREPLSYCNIGVAGKNIGGISREDGTFSVEMGGALPTDTVQISYIGYKTLKMGVTTFRENYGQQVILLEPTSLVLPEVFVYSNELPVSKIGYRKRCTQFTGWGDFDVKRGRERGGLFVMEDCPNKIKNFVFRIKHNTWDSVRFRLDISKYNDDNAMAEDLLPENVLFTVSEQKKWITVDLQKYSLDLCGKVLVGIEWVDAWGKEGENNMLTLGLSYKEGEWYTKEHPFAKIELEHTKNMPLMYFEVYKD